MVTRLGVRVARFSKKRRDSGKEARKAVRVVCASRARSSRLRPSGRKEILFVSRSGTQRLGDAATPRADAKWPDRRETAGRRGAFRGRKESDVPGDHSSLATARWCTPSCRSGRRLRGRGGSSVGPSVGTSEMARARERGGERTARLTRQREYRQRRDRLPVSCGRPRLRHDRLSGARARGAPLVLSRDVSRQQWRSHRKIAKGRLFASSSKT